MEGKVFNKKEMIEYFLERFIDLQNKQRNDIIEKGGT